MDANIRGPLDVGTTFDAIHRRLTYYERVTECDPAGKASKEQLALCARKIEGKTKLTESRDYRLSGFYKVAGLLLTDKARRETASRVGNVKRILESKARS